MSQAGSAPCFLARSWFNCSCCQVLHICVTAWLLVQLSCMRLLEYRRHTCWELHGFQTITEVFFCFTVPAALVDQQLQVENTDSTLTLNIW